MMLERRQWPKEGRKLRCKCVAEESLVPDIRLPLTTVVSNKTHGEHKEGKPCLLYLYSTEQPTAIMLRINYKVYETGWRKASITPSVLCGAFCVILVVIRSREQLRLSTGCLSSWCEMCQQIDMPHFSNGQYMARKNIPQHLYLGNQSRERTFNISELMFIMFFFIKTNLFFEEGILWLVIYWKLVFTSHKF